MSMFFKSLPSNFRPVAELIGAEKALELTRLFGGENIYIPTAETATRHARNERIKKDYRSGRSYSQMSQKYGLSANTIRNIISGG